MVDFLINYEHKAREIEAVCLIKAELERRGYSVVISCTYDEERIAFIQHHKAKVVLTSALYDDDCLYSFVYSIAGYCKKVINLHWEQSLTNQDEDDLSSYQNPKGASLEALHMCWGDEPRNRLLRATLSPDKAVVVGPIQMDFLRSEFADFYLDKKALARNFELENDKDWVLYISSFCYVNMTDEEYDAHIKYFGVRLQDFRSLSDISKRETVFMLEAAIKKYPNKIFIYRPHPGENNDPALLTMEAKHRNFRVIGDLSVKQWIKCCDYIITWYSTSIAEVFFSKKSCAILRPFEIPFEWDVSIYRGARTISNINQLFRYLENNDNSFPLNKSLLCDYFQVQKSLPTYTKICDLLERMLHSTDYDMRRFPFLFSIKIRLKQIRLRIFFIIKEALAKTDYRRILLNNRSLVKRMERHIAAMERLRRDREKNMASEKEISELKLKIMRIISGV